MKQRLHQDQFICCRRIWYNFLVELNQNPNSLNPLDIIYQSLDYDVIKLLRTHKYICQNKYYYNRKSREYMIYLSNGNTSTLSSNY